jgi:hypothetical protein
VTVTAQSHNLENRYDLVRAEESRF